MWMYITLLWVVLMLSIASGSPGFSSKRLNPLCVKSDAPCDASNKCTMQYIIRDSEKCANMVFNSDITPIGQLSLGGLSLKTYHYSDQTYAQTAFNISFYNVSWTEMRFGIYLNGNTRKNTCRRFIRAANSSMTDLSYDCLWSNESYEGKPYVLYYEAKTNTTTESSKLSFSVPFDENIRASTPDAKLELLTYVETMPSNLGRTTFNVMWQHAPEEYNVQCYNVFVFSNDSGLEEVMQRDEVCDCNVFQCSYTTEKWFGAFRFGVQPVFPSGVEGHVSKTQLFDLGGYSTRPLLVGLLTCSVLLPLLLYLLLLLRNYLVRRATKKTRPVVLFIYTPSTTPHLRMVEALAHYLNTNCNVTAVMDEQDIPNSQSKDPFVWCSEAIQSADVVAVIASPYYQNLRSSDALYRTDKLLLRLMRERLGTDGKTKYCVLMPPYTSANDIPLEASSLRKMRLPQDMKKLLHLAHFHWPLPEFLAPSLSGSAESPERRAGFLEALAVATQDIEENRTDYEKEGQELETVVTEKEATLDTTPLVEKRKTRSEPLDMFQGKSEQIAMAHAVFADDPEDLDRMNLLGDKNPAPILLSPKNPFVGEGIDLNQLVL